MTKARMAWRLAGEIDPSSIKVEGNTISCTVELPDGDMLLIEHQGHDLIIDKTAKMVMLDDRILVLPSQLYILLLELAGEPRKLHTATELYRAAWGGDLSKVRTRTVDHAVSNLRKHLPEGWLGNQIGAGWRLVPL